MYFRSGWFIVLAPLPALSGFVLVDVADVAHHDRYHFSSAAFFFIIAHVVSSDGCTSTQEHMLRRGVLHKVLQYNCLVCAGSISQFKGGVVDHDLAPYHLGCLRRPPLKDGCIMKPSPLCELSSYAVPLDLWMENAKYVSFAGVPSPPGNPWHAHLQATRE